MKKKRRNVPVYTNNRVKIQAQLTTQVDDAGDEWLTPDQVGFLEFSHAWGRYMSSNQLKASQNLIMSWQLAPIKPSDVRSYDLSSSLVWPSPTTG